MEIRRFLHSVQRMIWLIILLGVIGAGIPAYLNIVKATPMYKAETTIYAMSINSTADGGKGINYQDVSISRQLVFDYQYVLTSQKVISLASKLLDKYNLSQNQLISMINITPKDESSVIAISAISDDAKKSADISNAVTEAFISQLSEMTNSNIIGVLNEAEIPKVPIDNGATKKTIMGFCVGVIIAFFIIYIRELFDLKLRYIDDIEDTLKIKVIGAIPKYSIR
jgi:capsular polysaccharide biosynthesis protein